MRIARLSGLILVLVLLGSALLQPHEESARAAGSHIQVVLASSDLAVGPNRFTFGVIRNDHPLESLQPRLMFYSLQGSRAVLVARTSALFNNFAKGLKDSDANSAAIGIGGVYVSHVRFTRAGKWGVVVQFRYGGASRELRQGFTVARHSQTPAVGSPAPRSHNPTTAQEPAKLLDSGRPPDDMHKLSIASAIAQRKPLVVLFATAAFCTSRMCGPEIETVQKLERQYRGRVNFVHVEIYRDANPAKGYAPTVKQWHLQTEPWVFVVNKHGTIADKFEGPTPTSELVPAINRALGTS